MNAIHKRCCRCEVDLSIESFKLEPKKNSKGEVVLYRSSYCHDCNKERFKEAALKRKNRLIQQGERLSWDAYVAKKAKAKKARLEKLERKRKQEKLLKAKKREQQRLEREATKEARWKEGMDSWYASNEYKALVESQRLEAEQQRKVLEEEGKKYCSVCKAELPLSEFPIKKRRRKDGSAYKSYGSMCKPCKNRASKEYRKDNPDVIKAYKSQAHVKAARTERKRIREIRKSSNAVPNWLTPEMKQQIRDIYLHMRDCRLVTGEDYHVDHIVPLKGKNVCGLHVPWNLQVLPADINTSKSNEWEWGVMDQAVGTLRQGL